MIPSYAPRNILYVDHAADIGGAENSLLLLMTHLDPAEWRPHLATTNGRFAQTAAQANIPTHLFSLPRLRRSASFGRDGWRTAQELARLAQALDADILHANTVRAALYTALAARLAKRPFLWHMRDFWLSENKPRYPWLDSLGKHLLISAATCVIANSAATAAHLSPSLKIRVVPNGIDLSQFDPALDKRPFRAQYHIPPDALVVGMVGRLRPWKGQVHFLQMAAQIVRKQPDVRFLIVGGDIFNADASYPKQLEHLAEELQLTNHVIFTRQVDNVPEALAAMDIFVHPGDPEPFGLVNIEAMAMEKPVIAFAHGALPEIIVNGETGLLIAPYDTDAFATAVLQLLTAPAKCQEMGRAGRQRVAARFSAARMAAEVSNVLYEVLL